MAVHFHKLAIKEIKKVTPDCISIVFDVPGDLKQAFNFREGQNITIRKNINGVELRRSYSICNAPHEGSLKIAIKKVDGGIFSSFANDELNNGDTLDIMAPSGKFNAKDPEIANGNFLAIVAGSGITPVISIIKHVLATSAGSSFTLIYGNQSRGSVIFFDELEDLKNKFMERFNIINILSRERTDAELNYGRIDEKKLHSLTHVVSFQSFDDIYLCGPAEMIFTAEKFLKARGIEDSKIHFELFATPGEPTSLKSKPVNNLSPVGPQSEIDIKADGRSFNFKLAFEGDSILSAALKAGADLPFACKAGVCCTCRARLVEGKVVMDVNYALEPEELAQGFILTCQSHPITPKVLIDFDVK